MRTKDATTLPPGVDPDPAHFLCNYCVDEERRTPAAHNVLVVDDVERTQGLVRLCGKCREFVVAIEEWDACDNHPRRPGVQNVSLLGTGGHDHAFVCAWCLDLMKQIAAEQGKPVLYVE